MARQPGFQRRPDCAAATIDGVLRFCPSGAPSAIAGPSLKRQPVRVDGEDRMLPRTRCGRSRPMIVRIYTGQDGQTHFEDLPMPSEESRNIALQAGANLSFRSFPADYFSDWHTAPRRQYIFILAGQMEIGIGDGTTRRFGPGDVVLADDLTGQGHTMRSVGVPRISATVPVGA